MQRACLTGCVIEDKCNTCPLAVGAYLLTSVLIPNHASSKWPIITRLSVRVRLGITVAERQLNYSVHKKVRKGTGFIISFAWLGREPHDRWSTLLCRSTTRASQAIASIHTSLLIGMHTQTGLQMPCSSSAICRNTRLQLTQHPRTPAFCPPTTSKEKGCHEN